MYRLFYITLCLLFVLPTQVQSQYYPTRFDWEHREPAEVGMDAATIEAAVQYAIDHESSNPRELPVKLNTHASKPYNNIIGPNKKRGAMSG